VERAEIVVGRTEAKVQKSLGRLKGVKERRKDWEDVNGGRRKKGLMDVDDGGGGGEGVKKLPVLSKVPVEVDDASPAAVGEDEWEDEVL
jgi:hypothetical protein